MRGRDVDAPERGEVADGAPKIARADTVRDGRGEELLDRAGSPTVERRAVAASKSRGKGRLRNNWTLELGRPSSADAKSGARRGPADREKIYRRAISLSPRGSITCARRESLQRIRYS